MEFIIGSMNQAKVEAVQKVVKEHYPHAVVRAVHSDSEVSAQPIGDTETLQGAINRAKSVRKNASNAIGIGLEGGVRRLDGVLYICNWGALETPEGQLITAGGAQIPLPADIAKEIENGKELGPVIDTYFNKSQLRQQEGAMGMFTAGAITRVELFTHILQLLMGQLTYFKENHIR